MPLFPKKLPAREEQEHPKEKHDVPAAAGEMNGRHPQDLPDKQKLVFYCQQAQGSPTGLISGFTNVKELYQKISECYDFGMNEILFCTLNTHKINMAKLLGAQIALGDFIFVHRRGRSKEIELTKTEDALGLTITDNGNGFAFIKRIKEGSVIDQVPVIQVGDHIEKIDNELLVGKRHFEVAKCLKDIPKGTTFVIRLVEPLQAGFANIGPRGDRIKGKKQNYGSGRQTLRFKAGGEAVIEVMDDTVEKAVNGINAILENFFGINDSELATRIWELGQDQTNSMDFAEAIENSEMDGFAFTEDFIIELWGAITDARDGRLR